MDRQETIAALCQIVGDVGKHFNHEMEGDCFCGLNLIAFQTVNPTIIDFIRAAVEAKIKTPTLVEIQAWNVHTDQTRTYGPFQFVQATYEILRAQHLNDCEFDDEFAIYDHISAPDRWLFKDGFVASDFTIFSVERR